LDYLVMDLAPGTSDAQWTITQTGLLMFQQVRVLVLGIVENMSSATGSRLRSKPTTFDRFPLVE